MSFERQLRACYLVENNFVAHFKFVVVDCEMRRVCRGGKRLERFGLDPLAVDRAGGRPGKCPIHGVFSGVPHPDVRTGLERPRTQDMRDGRGDTREVKGIGRLFRGGLVAFQVFRSERLDDRILTPAVVEDVRVRAPPALEPVVAGPANQNILAVAAQQ